MKGSLSASRTQRGGVQGYRGQFFTVGNLRANIISNIIVFVDIIISLCVSHRLDTRFVHLHVYVYFRRLRVFHMFFFYFLLSNSQRTMTNPLSLVLRSVKRKVGFGYTGPPYIYTKYIVNCVR